MKILWFSNIELSEHSMSGTGTWINAMAEGLVKYPNVQLFVITKGNVTLVKNSFYKNVKQWILPSVPVNKKGFPPSWIISQIQSIVEDIKPDIIHVWGTEYYWSRLTASGLIQGNILLEMQGLVSAIAEKVTADLSIKEVLQCIGLKELIKPSSSILGRLRVFNRRGKIEKDIIAKHQFISIQSDWMRSHIATINPNAKIFKTVIGLRPEFAASPTWKYEECEKNRILVVTSTLSPYKGLHSIIKSFAIISTFNTDANLYIAGPKPTKGIKQPGYEKYLQQLIEVSNIQDKVHWIGPQDTEDLVNQMRKCNVFVNPSFIESYSLVVKESITLGVPTIVSYAGAMPELGIENESILFFPPGDSVICAVRISRLLLNPEQAISLSINCVREREFDKLNYLQTQLNIYETFFAIN